MKLLILFSTLITMTALAERIYINELVVGDVKEKTEAEQHKPQTTDDEEAFIDRSKEGWFWYIDPEPEPEPEEPVPLVIAPSSNESTEATTEKTTVTINNAYLREALPKALDAAMDEGTIESVRRYYYLQRIAMDKASNFEELSKLATQGDPFLDEVTRRPTSTFGGQTAINQAKKRTNTVLKKLGEKVALFYFYRSDCEYCRDQAPVINMIKRQQDFVVLPISIDGKDLPGAPFPNFKPDSGHAKLLGIKTLPALYLATPQMEFEPVVQGIVALPDLKRRVLIAAHRRQWISDQEFHSTSSVSKELSTTNAFDIQVDDPDNITTDELINQIQKEMENRYAE